jgi:multidrug resistance efflux pump
MEKETQTKDNIFKKGWIQSLVAVIIIFGSLCGFLFWQSNRNTVLIENSDLEAPIINLSPTSPGTLNALYVKEGDRVTADEQIALVGSQIISTKTPGIVSYAPNLLGAFFAPGQTVVSIVNDQDMKVVGSIEETKGLENIKAGQRATFTVDAFPGQTYEGVVDEISATSSDTGIVFSISDKRPTKKFDIKVKFDSSAYPELKSGMSAKIIVYTQ